jgi:hypothetical protein
MRVATSTDGYNFNDTSTHTSIGLSNGAGVKYNKLTNKYMLILGYNNAYYILESNSPTSWPTKNASELSTYGYQVVPEESGRIYAFPDFVTDGLGQITTETFYITYTNGVRSTTSDWRANHETWDGCTTAVEPKEYSNRTITLPNGKANTETNFAETYNERNTKYSKPSADAIYVNDTAVTIDGLKDDAYNGSTKIEVNRNVYNWGSNITTTYAETYIGWNENYMYAYIDVYDNCLSYDYAITSMASMYMRDSLDIFVDVPNNHTVKNEVYGLDQYMLSLGANNTDFIIKGMGEDDITDEFLTVQKRVRKKDFGYSIEIKIEWYEWILSTIKENACIGMDFQINDDMGGGVGREAMVAWSNHTGNSFRYIDNFGDIYLIK